MDITKKKIKSIKVNNIFGEFDYEVDFENDIKIIIGPNGSGKTTFFKIIHAIISNRHIELYEYEFDCAIILFDDLELKIEKSVPKTNTSQLELFEQPQLFEDENFIRKNEINYYIDDECVGILQEKDLPSLMYFSRHVPHLSRTRDYLYDVKTNEVYTADDKYAIIEKYNSYLPSELLLIPEKVADLLKQYRVTSILTDRLQEKNVYRSDISNRIYEHASIENCVMNIKQKMNEMTSKYAEFSQKIDQEFPIKIVDVLGKENYEDEYTEIEIFSEEVTDLRTRLINTGLFDINDKTYTNNEFDKMNTETLVVLKEYYNNMKEKMNFLIPLSDKIELLINLFNKKISSSGKRCYIDYKEGIYIKNKQEKKIPFERLSSGEQHEFVQLYTLIFEVEEGDIVLIDEPEISIHVSWQRHYISDLKKIMNDRKGITIIIATHSVQIVNNNWDIVLDLGAVEE